LFQGKESDEERKVKKRKSFCCLDLHKKVKERKNFCGTHVRNFSTHIWTEWWRKQVFGLKCPKCPYFYSLFILLFQLVSFFIYFFQFNAGLFFLN